MSGNTQRSDAQPWERLPGESLLWFRRFEQFRLMEPVRKIALVFQQEQRAQDQGEGKEGLERTEAPGKWYTQAKKWRWDERAAAFDLHQAKELEELIAAEKAKVISEGYALMHKRIETLNMLAVRLVAMTGDENHVWLPDVKSVGTGPNATRVDLVQFNAALFHEIREYFADIAEELGDRVKKKEIAFKDLPKVYIDLDPNEDGIDR